MKAEIKVFSSWWEERLARQQLGAEVLLMLGRFDQAELKALEQLLTEYHVNLNRTKELITFMTDIKLRDGLSVEQIISEAKKDIDIVVQKDQQYEKLRGNLKMIRYPVLSGKEHKTANKKNAQNYETKSKNIQFVPEIIYLEKSVKDQEVAKNILKALPDVPVELVDGPVHADRSVEGGKRILQIVTQKGKFLSECPGTPDMICCGYHVLNNAFNCNFDCTYCFLQSYTNNRIMTVYANVSEMFEEIDRFLAENSEYSRQNPLRLGTGEFTDSMALDHLTKMSKKFVEYFSSKDNVIFELKSKSNYVEPVLSIEHGDNIVMAWSLNTPEMIKDNELKTATLDERLAAAGKCAKAGYKIAFHFDPLIHYEGWESEYQNVVEKMYQAVPKEQIVWISMGTFRYNAPLRPIIRKRFPNNKIITGEFSLGQDGKMRYFEDIRIKMYRKMLSFIKEKDPKAFVYLCMEASDVWEKVFGKRLEEDKELISEFNKNVVMADKILQE